MSFASNLITGLGLRALGGLALAGVAGVLVLVDQGDKAMNYADANARVSELVDEDCWIQLGDEKWTEQNGKEVSCKEVGALVKLDPEGKAKIKGKRNLEVRYVSPVDNAEHTGRLTLTDSQAGFENVEENDELVILAHTSEADKIRAK